jgi:NADPH2:quinone reductase
MHYCLLIINIYCVPSRLEGTAYIYVFCATVVCLITRTIISSSHDIESDRSIYQARGKHQNNRSLATSPFILGLEFSGVVVSAPSSCEFSKGDRVFGGGQGSFADVISVKASNLRKIPERWTFSDAACLGATAPVSYGALISRGKLKQGETVLIHSAAGGLGLMAVWIARVVGARVIETASSEEKLAVARKYGAQECVNYTKSDVWWKEVLVLTKNVGVDLVFDSVGLVDKSLKCLKHKGRILVVGFAGREGIIEKIAMNRVLLKQDQIMVMYSVSGIL